MKNRNKRLTKLLTKEFLIKEYIGSELSLRQIAKELGCSVHPIYKRLKKYKIKTRTIQEGVKLLDRKGKNNTMFGIHITGKNHPRYIDNRTNKKHYCKNCGKEICYQTACYGSGLCMSCKNKNRFKNPANHPNWQDGKSFEEYPQEFNKELKESIRNRDNHICQLCGCSEVENGKQLDVHHVDYNKKNLNPENLISLCKSCHSKTNSNRDYYYACFMYVMENWKQCG